MCGNRKMSYLNVFHKLFVCLIDIFFTYGNNCDGVKACQS